MFQRHGVRLEDTDAPLDMAAIRFQEPCRCRWDGGDLVVEQA